MQEKSKYRVFTTGSGIAAEARRYLEEHGCEIAAGTARDTPEELAAKLKAFNPHALIVRQGNITSDIVHSTTNLKVICKHGVGTDNIDIDAATLAGLPVGYTPGANTESVATHTLALILASVRQVALQDRLIRKGIFEKRNYGGQELSGKILGLIGFGSIARRVSELVGPFQMRVLVYHPSNTDEDLPQHVVKISDFHEVVTTSDIISLHCPLTAETRHLFNSDVFQRMKKGSCLVNTSRGEIVNEVDLVAALQSQQIGCAALDVYESEPPDLSNPLLNLDNVTLSPHAAGFSDTSSIKMGMDAAQIVLSVLRGEPPDMNCIKNVELYRNKS